MSVLRSIARVVITVCVLVGGAIAFVRHVPWLREVKRGLGTTVPAVGFVGPSDSGIDASDHRSY